MATLVRSRGSGYFSRNSNFIEEKALPGGPSGFWVTPQIEGFNPGGGAPDAENANLSGRYHLEFDVPVALNRFDWTYNGSFYFAERCNIYASHNGYTWTRVATGTGYGSSGSHFLDFSSGPVPVAKFWMIEWTERLQNRIEMAEFTWTEGAGASVLSLPASPLPHQWGDYAVDVGVTFQGDWVTTSTTFIKDYVQGGNVANTDTSVGQIVSFDMGTPKTMAGVEYAGRNRNAYVTVVTIVYSDDEVTWEEAGTHVIGLDEASPPWIPEVTRMQLACNHADPHQYWGLRIDEAVGDADLGMVYFREGQAVETAGGSAVDVQFRPDSIMASSTFFGGNTNPTGLSIDDDTASFWSADGQELHSWIEYNFGGAVTLSRLRVWSTTGMNDEYWEVWVSDDRLNWKVAVEPGQYLAPINQWHNIDFPAVSGQYWRILNRLDIGGVDWMAVPEIEFIQLASPPAAASMRKTRLLTDAAMVASSVWQQQDADGVKALETMDGNSDGERWLSNGSGNHTIEADFGKPITVRGHTITAQSNNVGYQLESSDDGVLWTPRGPEVVGNGTNDIVVTDIGAEVEARYWRFATRNVSGSEWHALGGWYLRTPDEASNFWGPGGGAPPDPGPTQTGRQGRRNVTL